MEQIFYRGVWIEDTRKERDRVRQMWRTVYKRYIRLLHQRGII